MDMDELPSINDRLRELQPTRELLDFYRLRLNKCDNDNENIIERLSEFKKTCEQQFLLEKNLLEKDEEISALRNALSDIQACLYQEREHVLRLYAENDRLKIRELEDRKKIQQLLILCKDKYPNADLDYLIGGNQNKKKQTAPKTTTKPVNLTDPLGSAEFLNLKIEALRAELEEQTKLSRENLETLADDCRVTREESENNFKKHVLKIKSLNEKLKLSQDLLQKMTESYLELKRKHKNEEMSWFAQRDEYVINLNTLKGKVQPKKTDSQTNFAKSAILRTVQTNTSDKTESKGISLGQLEKAEKMSDFYRNQCLKLESQLSLLKEEKDAAKDIYNDRSVKLGNQLKLINSKYRDLENRHKLEVEGFRSDVKILRNQLQKVEKQLLKTAIMMTQTKDDEMLQTIHVTCKQSKYLSDNIRSLKAQIYQLEQDLKLF